MKGLTRRDIRKRVSSTVMIERPANIDAIAEQTARKLGGVLLVGALPLILFSGLDLAFRHNPY